MCRLIFIAFAAIVPASMFAQPVVNVGGVVNSATYATPGQPNGAIARGSIFTLFGTGLSQSTPSSPGAFPLPTTLGGTTVMVATPFFSIGAPLIYVSSEQISAIMPSSITEGSISLTVSYNGQSSAPVSVQVVTSSFGIFTLDARGNGSGVLTNSIYQTYSPTTSAIPGDVVTIWGTGLGPVTGDDGAGPQPGNMPSVPVQVWVGLAPAQILYQGRSGCCAGLDQVSFVVPQVASACALPVAVQIGNVVSNFVTLPIGGASRVCSDLNLPSNLTPAQVDASPPSRYGLLNVSRSTIPATELSPVNTEDEFSGEFFPLNSGGGDYYFAGPPPGACVIYPSYQAGTILSANPAQPNAGPALTLTGANGAVSIPSNSTGYGEDQGAIGSSNPGGAPLFLTPGTYTVSGLGGTDVGPFSQTITMPAPLTWPASTNTLTMVRAQGQTFTWSGAAAGNYVRVYGYFGSGSVGSTFSCLADGAAGQFTVPPFVLLSLPPSLPGYSVGEVNLDVLEPPVFFSATGLNLGIIQVSSSLTNENVTLQ